MILTGVINKCFQRKKGLNEPKSKRITNNFGKNFEEESFQTYDSLRSNKFDQSNVKCNICSKKLVASSCNFLRRRISSITRPDRSYALFSASRLDHKGSKMIEEGKIKEAFDCFTSAMKIYEKYAKFSLNLATSYTQVGLAILDKEFVSTSYARIALKCLSRALAIQKAYHHQRRGKSLETSSKSMITELDLATSSCYVARAYLLLREVNTAHEQASYALQIVKKYEESAVYDIDLSLSYLKCKYVEALSLCYSTIANTFAERMKTSKDEDEAIKYYRLAIYLEEEKEINSFAVARTHSELALFLHNIGKSRDALKHYTFAYQIRERKSLTKCRKKEDNENKLSICNLLNNIALVLRDLGQANKAMLYLKKAISTLPPDCSNFEVLFIAGNLGNLHSEYFGNSSDTLGISAEIKRF